MNKRKKESEVIATEDKNYPGSFKRCIKWEQNIKRRKRIRYIYILGWLVGWLAQHFEAAAKVVREDEEGNKKRN